EDAAVEGVQMNEPIELGIAARSGLAPGSRPLGAEEILDAAAEARDMPREPMTFDRGGYTRLEALAEEDHPRERLVGENLGERSAHRRKRQDVRRNRAADAADIRALVPR